MDKLFNNTAKNLIHLLCQEMIEIENLLNHTPKWSEPRPINDNQEFGGKFKGVYKIIYRPYYETETFKELSKYGLPYVMYIGQGNVNERHARHKSVFKNGKNLLHAKSSSGSQAAVKMHEFDDDIDNWLFSYCNIGVKSLCSKYEKALQNEENPEFNNSSMNGCN
tara:strand:- start:6 stop:500 length:495 start_codon:yes stop_codon:yes gene_type:complete